jgi:predicted dehydrogenase
MECRDATVRMVCDVRPDRVAQMARRYPTVRTTTQAADLFAAPDVDAVVIATPVDRHFELAMTALQAGKHVLVEKPMASTSEQAAGSWTRPLAAAGADGGSHLRLHGAVRKMRELTGTASSATFYYYDSVRINLGLVQPDVNVLWDLAVHDLSIMDFVLDREPTAVSATGLAHLAGGARPSPT